MFFDAARRGIVLQIKKYLFLIKLLAKKGLSEKDALKH